ncbi:hypothetical protein N7468_004978 [Penicillium chermesinum]|uniref:Myb-like domain-containing protein n=1 Tax=Penicillium chermesinum TaxID=63820 RepID=A0A9W9NYE9_9EURO|nr:uncharacterized protein N7468_004978 [Penicillium chermesinum]KAJ5232022.1 hypothetical protein N7468_004978 [Penicillium chermesinum]
MSNPPDRPWTEEEKYFLLTEILKKASVHHSHLVRLINEFRRSLNSCRIAYDAMLAQAPSQPAMPSPSVQMPRPEARATAPVDPNLRKRPLYPSDKPRAIQPRPPPSVASYSSESGASTQLSPGLEAATGEPPRKRGRPSKAETERRKAAAEARGETYPPPRRLGSRMKASTSPTSPPGPPIPGPAPPPQPYGYPGNPPMHAPSPISGPIPFDPVGPARQLGPAPSFQPGTEERRDSAARGISHNPRELPRPQELGLPVHSHALQLGPPNTFPRTTNESMERTAFGAIPPDRYSPDSGRRGSANSRGDPPPPGPYPERRASITPGEKPR